MKTNKKNKTAVGKKIGVPSPRTGGGAVASNISAELTLRRCVLSCMLWENIAYTDGNSVADEISILVKKVQPEIVASLAKEARNVQKLRHVPLWLVREMAKLPFHKHLVADTLEEIIQRPDELLEFLSLYWKDGKQPLSAQVKKGLARAFTKFDEYSLAKYNRKEKVTLRDVLALCHPIPKNPKQEDCWSRLLSNSLQTPDTWEVELSRGAEPKATWQRLLTQKKLGSLALLRNLRNMERSNVEDTLIRSALANCEISGVLPFQIVSAMKHAPRYITELESLLFKSCDNLPRLKGKTIVVVDVSGSMGAKLSEKSTVSRQDTASALAAIIREISDVAVVYATAGNDSTRIHKTQMVTPHRGFALINEIQKVGEKLGYGGIFLSQLMDFLFRQEKTADRIIVISDSQDCDLANKPDSAVAFGKNNYLMDISTNRNGIAYSKFTVINGFSENLVRFITEMERFQENCQQPLG